MKVRLPVPRLMPAGPCCVTVTGWMRRTSRPVVPAVGIGRLEEEGEQGGSGRRNLSGEGLGNAASLPDAPRVVAAGPPGVEFDSGTGDLEPARQRADLVVPAVVLQLPAPRAGVV